MKCSNNSINHSTKSKSTKQSTHSKKVMSNKVTIIKSIHQHCSFKD